MLDRFLAALCLFTAAVMVWFELYWITDRPPGLVVKLLIGACVLALSLGTLAAMRRRPGLGPGVGLEGFLLSLGGFGLMALGAKALYDNLKPSAVDFEGYLVVTGAALVVQGFLTVARFAFTRDPSA